jgi:hypothetical protein
VWFGLPCWSNISPELLQPKTSLTCFLQQRILEVKCNVYFTLEHRFVTFPNIFPISVHSVSHVTNCRFVQVEHVWAICRPLFSFVWKLWAYCSVWNNRLAEFHNSKNWDHVPIEEHLCMWTFSLRKHNIFIVLDTDGKDLTWPIHELNGKWKNMEHSDWVNEV